MHDPPHRYTTRPIPAASLPQHSRWTCIRPTPPDLETDWCGVKHTTREYAEKHCRDPKKPPGYDPHQIHRIERYSDTELSYRGWTKTMLTHLLGKHDAQEVGTLYVYRDIYYDADRVHLAESGPDFDRLAAAAHNTGEPTIYEDDITPILTAITTALHLELPHTSPRKLLRYAKNDIKRMTRERAHRDRRRYHALEISDEEATNHAAARCSWRSHSANQFVHRMRGHHLRHQATRIVDARLAHAAAQVLPHLAEPLAMTAASLSIIPAMGRPLPWRPAVRAGPPVNRCRKSSKT